MPNNVDTNFLPWAACALCSFLPCHAEPDMVAGLTPDYYVDPGSSFFFQTVLVSSDADGVDHAVRYLSLYDNQFLRFFTGHTDKVVSIAMSPTDDHFMTGSADK